LNRNRMIASITNGRPGTAMMGYGSQFSQADIEAMADFIREAFMSGSSPKK
jgi:cytochrome c553